MSINTQAEIINAVSRKICVKIENDVKKAMNLPIEIVSRPSPKLDFKKLKPWQRQILINTLMSDKHIPNERKLDIMRSNRKDIPYPPVPRGNVRGKRADMIIFDCSMGCRYIDDCKNGKECPYDKED